MKIARAQCQSSNAETMHYKGEMRKLSIYLRIYNFCGSKVQLYFYTLLKIIYSHQKFLQSNAQVNKIVLKTWLKLCVKVKSH